MGAQVPFKVMLCPHQDPLGYPKYFEELKFPLWASPKLDGIRCVVKGGVCYSRSFKPIPSLQVQDLFGHMEHFDGELVVGDMWNPDVYNLTQSHVMSENKPADVRFCVFDYTGPKAMEKTFAERYLDMANLVTVMDDPRVHLLTQEPVGGMDELLAFESRCLEWGYEGVIMKSPTGRYKNGRATWREGTIYKLKRFADAEAPIVDLIEQVTNNNPKERDELGHAKRSGHQENLEPAGTLGRFVVMFEGIEIDVAPGQFTHSQRKEIWERPEEHIGRVLKFRYMAHGMKDRPRFPRAVGFRSEEDT